MRIAWRTNFWVLLLCGTLGVFACPQRGTAGKMIAFSDPSEPQEEMETQKERAPARTIGGVNTDPGTAVDAALQMPRINPRKATKKDSKRDPFGTDSTKSDDSNDKEKNDLLSPRVKTSSFEKGWSADSYSSKEPWRSSRDSRTNDKRGSSQADINNSDFRSRSAADDFRRVSGADFPDQERSDDLLKRQIDRVQRNTDTLTRGGLDSMLRAQTPGVTLAPPEAVSQLHDSIWQRPDDRPGLSSRNGDSMTRDSDPYRDSFSSSVAGRARSPSDDFGRSSFSSPGYQTRSSSSPDQPNSPAQRSVFLPVPRSPGSVFK